MSNQLEMVSGLSRYSTLAEASYGDFKPALQDDGSYKQSIVEDAIKDTGNKNNFSATPFQRIDTDHDSGLKAGFRA